MIPLTVLEYASYLSIKELRKIVNFYDNHCLSCGDKFKQKNEFKGKKIYCTSRLCKKHRVK